MPATIPDVRVSRRLWHREKKLEDTLASFGVAAKVVNITHGPAITRFELTPGPGIKVSRIVNLTDDLALAMAAVGVRIEAPIPGKSAIGIEIPNSETSAVTLRGLIDTPTFRKNSSPLVAALGRDIPGNPIFCDLAKMPHLLIAGATGSGKSVCINSILISILCKATPDQVKLIMIDPKVVELSIYNGIPHLLAPVVTDPKKAANTLNWAVGEMTRRYGLFAEASVRDFRGYNEELHERKEQELPLILIVIDELADLMQVASKEVEESIARLTAMARAAGIHLLIATQRPSVDVITGVIKANIPSRIAFAVSSQVDSRTILDMVGAEKLLGKGDMLYYPQSAAKPQRGQGAFVSDAEVESVIEYLKAQNLGSYDPAEAEAITSASAGMSSADRDSGDEDELLPQAVDIVLLAGCASVSILQRRMNIGYPRAARLIDHMQEKGYIGPFEGSKPRKLLISQSQWLEIKAKGGQ
jgi:DNA segregation ATPase FtsK/SpoIIIE-like protein